MAEYTSRAAAYDQNIKLLLIGDSGVGKTCLMLRYAQDMFSPTFITTVGIDYKYKFVTIDGKKIRLEIWDTAGQERFKAITRSYLRGAQGILLTYDVTDRRSFLHVDHWMGQIMQYAELTVDKCLVGNKSDLESRREVSREEGEALAAKHNILHFESSAKDNKNVDEAFMAVAKAIMNRESKGDEVKSPKKVVLEESSSGGGCGC